MIPVLIETNVILDVAVYARRLPTSTSAPVRSLPDFGC